MWCAARVHVIPNTAALVGPTEARPNLDPLLPLWSRDDRASRSCVALDGRLSRAAEFASLSRGLVLRWSFFLLVRWRPPLRGRLVVSRQSPAVYDPVLSMIATFPSLRDVSCCLSRERGWWSLLLAQPCGSECPGRIHDLPCSTLPGGCLPLRLSDWYQEDLEGRAPPIGFLVSALPVLGSFLSCRLATQWIASYVLLYRTRHLQSWKNARGR